MFPRPTTLIVAALALAVVCLSTATGQPPKADPPAKKADPFTQSADMRKLAHLAFEAGLHKEALDLFAKWRPATGCGTCNDSLECSRLYHIALCHAHLKDYRAAVEVCYKATRMGGMDRSAVGLFVFELYRDAGQLDDLNALFEVDNPRVRDPITETLRELFRVRALGEKKDVTELIKACQEFGSTHTFTYENPLVGWRARAASEELARCGEDAVKPIAEAIDARQKCVSWLIYALGRHPSGKALDALEALVAKESSWNSGNVAYAISLHGEAGKKLLGVIAKQENRGVQAKADDILNGRFKVESSPVYPKPKAGSLPNKLFE